MGTKLKILYLYNSGVLLSYGEESILIDGVFNANNIFDKMPPGYKETFLRREIPFDHVDVLLFTHCHDDHYDEDTVKEFAKRYVKAHIVAPTKGRGFLLRGEKGRFKLGAFDIEYLKARHIYVGSLTCDNYVYKVTAGNRSVVITGDTDPESLGRITDVFGCDSDVFLINAATFLYEMKRAETTILKSIKNLYVYHLTAEDNDDYGYRKATVSIMGKARQYLSNTKYLLDNVTYI